MQPLVQPEAIGVGAESNRPPQIASVSLSPAAPRVGEPVHAIVDASDPEGDRIRYRYAWQVGERRFAAARDTLERVRLRKGDAIVVTVTASDGRSESEPFQAATTVRNSPPQLVEVWIEPGEVRSGDEVRAQTRAEDRDGDSFSFQYTWRVNGIASGGDESTFSTQGLERGDAVSVEVVAGDGEEWSAALHSGDVKLDNSAPVITSEPSPPGRDGVFRYRVAAEDPDGDRPLRVSLGEAPEGMTVDAETGDVEWRPRRQQAGRHRVKLVVTDVGGARATQSFEMVVGDDPPAAPASGSRTP
jgi:uncharacterized OB-fold protein